MMCLIVFSSHSEKAEDLIEKSEDDVVVGDITRFVKEFKIDVERKISVYMDVESRDKEGMAEKPQAMRDKIQIIEFHGKNLDVLAALPKKRVRI